MSLRCLTRLLLSLSLFLATFVPVSAHELRPAFLHMQESGIGAYDISWKVPARGDLVLPLSVRFPPECEVQGSVSSGLFKAALIRRWKILCDGGLVGKHLFIDGLASTFTDALIRIERHDGTKQTARLTPDDPRLEVAEHASMWLTAWTYFLLGIEHILLGIDHLLFVLALLLLIRNARTLVATITAFTVAHSITLGFATFNLVRVPLAPIEALIALSIVFIAAETIRWDRGKSDLSIRHPWIVAFLFGLLHGFGFGSALQEIGLPQKDIPLALLAFNLGVEIGQLGFIAVILAFGAAVKSLLPVHDIQWRKWISYVIGSVSAFWFVERLAAF